MAKSVEAAIRTQAQAKATDIESLDNKGIELLGYRREFTKREITLLERRRRVLREKLFSPG